MLEFALEDEDLDNIVTALIIARKLCRTAKEYGNADKYRKTLEHMKIVVEDYNDKNSIYQIKV